MNEQYIAPELKLVGQTDEVVLGLGGVGPDVWGEEYIPEMEFLPD